MYNAQGACAVSKIARNTHVIYAWIYSILFNPCSLFIFTKSIDWNAKVLFKKSAIENMQLKNWTRNWITARLRRTGTKFKTMEIFLPSWWINRKSLDRLRRIADVTQRYLPLSSLHEKNNPNIYLRIRKFVRLSLWPSGISSRLGRNRSWVRFLAVADIYPMFIKPTITWVPSGFSGYIWLDTKIVLKKKKWKKQDYLT